jgi:hypothetical protein
LRRKTNAQFQQEVHDLVGNEYTFLDEYVNTRTKLRVKHSKCNNVYEVNPRNFLTGSRCPYCAGVAKKTDKQFKKEIFDLVGDEYTFLDPYQGSHIKLKVNHNKCGRVYEVRPYAFLQGGRCPYCFGTPKKTDAQFKQEIFNLVGNEYTFLESYINSATKIKVKHNKCGHIYRVEPNSFIHGSRCPYCCWGHKKTSIEFAKEMFNLVGTEYTLLDAYTDAQTKVRIKHNKCNNVYTVAPRHFLEGQRCPYCNIPKGETIINKLLKSLGIKYEYQKTFDDLRDNRLLSYDFYIPSQNILIEYQGQQHYEPIDHFGGEYKFKTQRHHDKMKADYAKSNNYNLITVPYTKDTFSKIKEYLLQHGLTA